VKLGDRVGEFVEVIDGLAEGEVVAASEVLWLDTGSRVKVERIVQGGASGQSSDAPAQPVPPT
jgi:hypothetical protein